MKTTEFTLNIDDKDVVFEVRKPTLKDRQEADKLYRKLVNQMVNEEGSLMKMDLAAFARKRGLWNDEKDAEYTALEAEIDRIETIVSTGVDPVSKQRVKFKDAERLAKECREELRPKLFKLRRVLSDLEDLTAEGQAETHRYMYLMGCSVFYKDSGKKVFANYEDLMNRQDEHLTVLITSKFTGVYYNVDDNYFSKLPENKFLKDYGFIDEKLRYIKDGQLVDYKGRKIDEEGYLLNDEGKRVDENGVLIDISDYLVDGKPVFLDDDGKPIENKTTETFCSAATLSCEEREVTEDKVSDK